MARALIIAVTVLLLSAGAARAATPVAPPTGSGFNTTDTVTFEAQPAPGESDGDYMFVYSTLPDLTASEWIALGGEDHENELDLGWLAGKLNHVGTYWWALCPVTEDADVLTDQCSPSARFSLRFRLPDLTSRQAATDARYVMGHQFRSYWRGLSARKVSCARVRRTRQRCSVSGFAADSVLSGTVTIYLKRHRTWTATYFRGRVRLLNEYCHLVNEQPLSECQNTRRRSGQVYA